MSKINKTNKDSTEVYYTILGKHQNIDEENNPLVTEEKHACAKKRFSTVHKAWKYYIKLNNEGRFFNPMGMYDEMANRTAMRMVAREKFIEVTPKVFDLYLSFLKTKNNSYLLNAQRAY